MIHNPGFMGLRKRVPMKPKLQDVPLDHTFIIPPSREEGPWDKWHTSLMNNIANRGQMTPCILMEKPNGLTILNGIRRIRCLQKLKENGVTDPKTGKPFATVQATVLPDGPYEEFLSA